MQNRLDGIAAAGLGTGAVFGMIGTMVASQQVRAAAWALDGTALIVATCLLALRYFRRGNDALAAGFLVYAIGEAIMLSGTAMTLEASVPSFGAGTALWAAGLLMTSLPDGFAGWVRGAGVVAALLFAITSARIFWGETLTPIASPLPYFAYPFLVLTFAGWVWTLVKTER
jgi:hypothetical protein